MPPAAEGKFRVRVDISGSPFKIVKARSQRASCSSLNVAGSTFMASGGRGSLTIAAAMAVAAEPAPVKLTGAGRGGLGRPSPFRCAQCVPKAIFSGAGFLAKCWSERRDLNSGPPVPQTGALTGLRYAPTLQTL
jgi:hypothetical protein